MLANSIRAWNLQLLAPPDLRQRVADEAARMTQMYAGTDTIKR
jgi:hypothetical protein